MPLEGVLADIETLPSSQEQPDGSVEKAALVIGLYPDLARRFIDCGGG